MIGITPDATSTRRQIIRIMTTAISGIIEHHATAVALAGTLGMMCGRATMQATGAAAHGEIMSPIDATSKATQTTTMTIAAGSLAETIPVDKANMEKIIETEILRTDADKTDKGMRIICGKETDGNL